MLDELAIFGKLKVEELKAHLIGKYHALAAIRHLLEKQQATQVMLHDIYLRAVQRIVKLWSELCNTARIASGLLQSFIDIGTAGQYA
jgi:hypothetical protein